MKIQCTRTDLLMEKKGSNNGNVPEDRTGVGTNRDRWT